MRASELDHLEAQQQVLRGAFNEVWVELSAITWGMDTRVILAVLGAYVIQALHGIEGRSGEDAAMTMLGRFTVALGSCYGCTAPMDVSDLISDEEAEGVIDREEALAG